MQDPRSHTCCFSGYRPEKMPFRTNDPDAVQALEAALDRAVEHAVSQGYHTFLSGMAAGFDIWAAEAVIRARIMTSVCCAPFRTTISPTAFLPRGKSAIMSVWSIRTPCAYSHRIISPAVFPCATASWSTLPPCSSATSTGRPAARHRPFTTHRAAACASSISPFAHMISFPCSDPSPRRPLLRTAMFFVCIAETDFIARPFHPSGTDVPTICKQFSNFSLFRPSCDCIPASECVYLVRD